MTDVLVALTTVGRPEDADRIASALVERGLAACVNVVPGVMSTYRWKGEVEKEGELLLVIKTTRARFAELRDALLGLHPYELPELVAVAVEDGHRAYLDWVRAGIS